MAPIDRQTGMRRESLEAVYAGLKAAEWGPALWRGLTEQHRHCQGCLGSEGRGHSEKCAVARAIAIVEAELRRRT